MQHHNGQCLVYSVLLHIFLSYSFLQFGIIIKLFKNVTRYYSTLLKPAYVISTMEDNQKTNLLDNLTDCLEKVKNFNISRCFFSCFLSLNHKLCYMKNLFFVIRFIYSAFAITVIHAQHFLYSFIKMLSSICLTVK